MAQVGKSSKVSQASSQPYRAEKKLGKFILRDRSVALNGLRKPEDVGGVMGGVCLVCGEPADIEVAAGPVYMKACHTCVTGALGIWNIIQKIKRL